MGLTRRQLLGGTAAGAAGLLWWRDSTDTGGFGFIGGPDVLRIRDGEDIDAAGGSYDRIEWEQNGSLSFENGDSITLT